MAEVCSARPVKYIKNKMASVPLQSRERRSGPESTQITLNPLHSRGCPVKCLIMYDIHCTQIIILCYFSSYLVKHFFKKRRWARMRVHVSTPGSPVPRMASRHTRSGQSRRSAVNGRAARDRARHGSFKSGARTCAYPRSLCVVA